MRGRVWGKGGVGGELEAYSLLVWASSQQAPSHTCISPQICRHDWSDDEMRLDSGKMRWCGAMRRLPCRHPPVPRQPARPDASGTFTLTPADPNLVQTAVFQLSTTSAEAAITTWSSPHISHPPDVVQQLSDLHVHDVPPGPPPATAIPSRDALSALRPGPMAVRAGFPSHAGVLQPHVPRQSVPGSAWLARSPRPAYPQSIRPPMARSAPLILRLRSGSHAGGKTVDL